ncbi:uncharacterized protein LOC142776025 isoform X2 [Rhipicephalus microplus]|uniref:uncharacterized protein LOC142776025 isoform X2 n=1 Tax=Rhipicephalus microplus TaxID=6941 RepID=UPI003F6BDBFD
MARVRTTLPKGATVAGSLWDSPASAASKWTTLLERTLVNWPHKLWSVCYSFHAIAGAFLLSMEVSNRGSVQQLYTRMDCMLVMNTGVAFAQACTSVFLCL